MKPYSSYKDSGVEWIQKIPFSWNKSRVRMVGELYGGLTGKKGDDFNNEDNPSNKPFVPFTNIFNNTYISKNHFQYVNISEGENQNRVLKYDLFFLMSSESYEDLGKCSILLDDIDELYLNSFCKGYRVKDKRVNPIFLNYQLLGSLHKEMISIEGNGFTRINLRQNRLLDIPVFLPPIDEQTQIISLLDTKTQKIDELIKKTEHKIILLKEKRTTLINHCVTKGLNPDVEMKDSGVEWIGDIPSHWNVKLMKFIIKPIREKTETGDEELLSVLIKKGVVRRKDFLGKKSENITRSESLVGYIKCSKGNLVNNIMKMGFYCLGISDFDGIVSPGYSVFEMINKKDYPKYWDLLLKTEIYVDEYRKRSKGIQKSRMRLYDDYFLSIHSLYPPKEEQTQIVEYLDEQTQKIDSTIEKETQRIELLKEYRQSLISEVVTGKVDVRGWKE